MTPKLRRVALIGKYQASAASGMTDSSLQALEEIASFMTHMGCEVMLEAETAANTGLRQYASIEVDAIANCDVGLVVGGDGTMLGIARRLARHGTPLIGINQGRLGFITDIPLEDAHAALGDLLEGRFETEERMLLAGEVLRDQTCLFSATALNDVVISRAGRGGMLEVRIDIDGVYMYTLRADGLIIATPTGSTAYSLAASGPILHPGINAMLLVPVSPQTLSNRPIVLPDTATLSLTVIGMSRIEAGGSVNFDMQTWSDVHLGDQVQVQRAPHTVKFLHPRGYSFFSTLRKKLDWHRLPATGHNEE